MKKLYLLGVCACVLNLGIVSSASATFVVYTYTGNTFSYIKDENPPEGTYSDTDFVSIEFTVPEPLINLRPFLTPITPTSYSITDQRNTFSSATPPPYVNFNVITDEMGDINDWSINVHSSDSDLFDLSLGEQSIYIFSDSDPTIAGDVGSITECTVVFGSFCEATNNDYAGANMGTWTKTVIPVPPALWLFGSGLLGLVGIARRKKTA